MPELNEAAPAPRRNPLAWIALLVIGLILFVFLSGKRDDAMPRVQSQTVASIEPVEIFETTDTLDSADAAATAEAGEAVEADETVETVASIDTVTEETNVGTIERSLLLPPGMRAREYIQKIREAGKPYPLSQVFERAQKFYNEGSLADAHLLYFFAARESHLPSVMKMAEMSDPLLFQAQNSLLDQADATQALKWYRMAAELGQPGVDARLEALRGWVIESAAAGDAAAEQLLLNIQ